MELKFIFKIKCFLSQLLDTLHNSYAGDNDNQDWKRLVKKIADISRVHLAGHRFENEITF